MKRFLIVLALLLALALLLKVLVSYSLIDPVETITCDMIRC